MQKLLSTLLTIILFQTSIFAFPVSFPIALNNYNLILEMAKSRGDKQTYKTALKAIKEIPNSLKETYYATTKASNVENLQSLGYSIGDRVYDYKENPMLLAKDATSLFISYDMYEAGFNNDNMFYATGLIVGGLALDIAGAPIKAGKGIVKTAKATEKIANVTKKTNLDSAYKNIQEVSQYLIKEGVSREQRIAILNTFDIKTVSLIYADNSTYGLRFFDNINSFSQGHFLFDTFTPQTNRINLSLPYNWNLMTNIKQFKIKEGTAIIKGKAASQIQYGNQYIGGANQWYILEKKNLLDLQ